MREGKITHLRELGWDDLYLTQATVRGQRSMPWEYWDTFLKVEWALGSMKLEAMDLWALWGHV